MNFYYRFIQGFLHIAAPLTETTQGFNVKSKKKLILQRTGFLSLKTQTAFRSLVLTFTTASFLQHFNIMLLIHLETDASEYTISGILSQKHLNGWRVTAYFSQKMIPAEQKYKTYNRELLAIVKSFHH